MADEQTPTDPAEDFRPLVNEFRRLVYAMAAFSVVNIAAVLLTWMGLR